MMKIVHVKRKTGYEKKYSPKMGELSAKITYIRKYVLGVPIKTLHKYRETYNGDVKDCQDCVINA